VISKDENNKKERIDSTMGKNRMGTSFGESGKKSHCSRAAGNWAGKPVD